MFNERYYYTTLSKEEKVAYKMIYNGVKMRALNIVVPVHFPPQRIQEIYLMVLFEHPMFYYINQLSIRMMGEPGYYILLPEYLYSVSEIERIDQDINNILSRIDVKAREMRDNEFRLEKFLHDSVVKSVAYDYESLQKSDCYNAHSIVGVFLDKKAVCEGIAKAFKLLCNKYGMKCIVVIGKADPNGRFDGDTYHAWNIVKVGNGSYHVDVTWDNMFDREYEHISYDYFNVTTEDILKDHRPMGQLPYCKDIGLNYFHCTNSFVSSYEDLVDLMCHRMNAKSIMFKIKPGSSEFRTMEDFKNKTFLALTHSMLMTGSIRKPAVVFNESQWIGKVLFSTEDMAIPVPHAVSALEAVVESIPELVPESEQEPVPDAFEPEMESTPESVPEFELESEVAPVPDVSEPETDSASYPDTNPELTE